MGLDLQVFDIHRPAGPATQRLPFAVTAGPELQVLYTVVLPVTVDVMDRLMLPQRPPEVLGHDEAVLKDVAVVSAHRRERMLVGDGNLDVATIRNAPPTLPCPVLRAGTFAAPVCIGACGGAVLAVFPEFAALGVGLVERLPARNTVLGSRGQLA